MCPLCGAGIARPVLKQLAPAALYAVQQPELLGESTNVAQALVERLHLGFGQVLLLTSMCECTRAASQGAQPLLLC